MHHIILWKWHDPTYRVRYGPEIINAVVAMLDRHTMLPCRVLCITDDPAGVECETAPLWDDLADIPNPSGGPNPKGIAHMPSCFRRLKLFDPETQKDLGIGKNDRIVSLDADVCIVNDPSPLWVREGSFVGYSSRGTVHRRVVNGTMFMFTAGHHSELWTEFDPAVSPKETKGMGFFGSDQGWLSRHMAGRFPCWTDRDGMLSYSRDVRPHRVLPRHGRIVGFHGKRKPWHGHVHNESPWVAQHWPADIAPLM